MIADAACVGRTVKYARSVGGGGRGGGVGAIGRVREVEGVQQGELVGMGNKRE